MKNRNERSMEYMNLIDIIIEVFINMNQNQIENRNSKDLCSAIDKLSNQEKM